MENNKQPVQEFRIKKIYEGYPSKDNNNYFKGTYEKCVDEIEAIAWLGRRNGGDIIEHTKTKIVFCNYDNITDVTFEIETE